MSDDVQSTPVRADSSPLNRETFTRAFAPYRAATAHTRDQIVRGATLIVMSAEQYLNLTGLSPHHTKLNSQTFPELPWLQVEPISSSHWRVNLCGSEQSARLIAAQDPESPLPVLILHEEEHVEGYRIIQGLNGERWLRHQIGEPLSPQRLHTWLGSENPTSQPIGQSRKHP